MKSTEAVMFNSFYFYKIDISQNLLLIKEHTWDELSKKNQITPFVDLPPSVSQGVSKVEGFTHVLPKLTTKELNFHSADYTIINYCIEQKKVKPAILKRAIFRLEQKALKELGLEFLSKERKKDIKEMAKIAELKRAVEDRTETIIVINKNNGWLAVGNSSESACEKILATLRGYLGSLPIIRLTSPAASTIFTGWVKSGKIPENTNIDDSCTLTYDSRSTTYKNQSVVVDDEVLKNIELGKEVTCLPFTIGEIHNEFGRVSFNLNEKLKVNGLKFKVNKEERDDTDHKHNMNADALLFCSYLSDIYQFIQDEVINFSVSLDEFS